MSVQIIYNAAILSFGKEPVIPDDAVAWDESGILKIGSSTEIRDRYKTTDGVDAGRRMVTPGLINLHSHLYSTLARGLAPVGQAPANFPDILESFWWRWDKCLDLEAVTLSAQLGLLSSLDCGVTTVFDHHSSPAAVRGSLNAIADAYQETGLRGSLCYEVSDRDGSTVTKEGIEENLAFADAVDANKGRLTSHFGLHANFTLSNDTLREVADRISSRDLGIHIHMAEDDSDNHKAASLSYSGPVERLNQFGLLNDRALLIHGVHLAKDQWDIVRQRNAHIIHNPASNMNNAVGIAPINDMLDEGLSVGLGTDGYGAHMLTSMNLAQLAAKINANDPRQGNWAVSLLTEANPHIASAMLGKDVGILKPGAVADIVLWDYQPITPVDSQTAGAHLLFGLQYAKPLRIWVDSQQVWQQDHSTQIDEQRLVQESQKLVSVLWTRFKDVDSGVKDVRG